MIYLNGTAINATRFPDNTTQVWKISESILERWNTIKWEFSHEGEFLELAQLKNLIDSYGYKTKLFLKYLPYGRQDKNVANDVTFALHTFANLLNTLNFTEVTIVDPHSEIAIDLIDRSNAYYPTDLVLHLFDKYEHNLLCFPDKGAVTKYTKIYQCSYMYGEKVRDQSTGNITSYEIKGQPVRGQKVLIVDDICDGGMTFKILAKDLLAAGATEVNLFVTHGIFSKGLKTLIDSGIKHVFTQDGEASEHENKLTYRRL